MSRGWMRRPLLIIVVWLLAFFGGGKALCQAQEQNPIEDVLDWLNVWRAYIVENYGSLNEFLNQLQDENSAANEELFNALAALYQSLNEQSLRQAIAWVARLFDELNLPEIIEGFDAERLARLQRILSQFNQVDIWQLIDAVNPAQLARLLALVDQLEQSGVLDQLSQITPAQLQQFTSFDPSLLQQLSGIVGQLDPQQIRQLLNVVATLQQSGIIDRLSNLDMTKIERALAVLDWIMGIPSWFRANAVKLAASAAIGVGVGVGMAVLGSPVGWAVLGGIGSAVAAMYVIDKAPEVYERARGWLNDKVPDAFENARGWLKIDNASGVFEKVRGWLRGLYQRLSPEMPGQTEARRSAVQGREPLPPGFIDGLESVGEGIRRSTNRPLTSQ